MYCSGFDLLVEIACWSYVGAAGLGVYSTSCIGSTLGSEYLNTYLRAGDAESLSFAHMHSTWMYWLLHVDVKRVLSPRIDISINSMYSMICQHCKVPIGPSSHMLEHGRQALGACTSLSKIAVNQALHDRILLSQA